MFLVCVEATILKEFRGNASRVYSKFDLNWARPWRRNKDTSYVVVTGLNPGLLALVKYIPPVSQPSFMSPHW